MIKVFFGEDRVRAKKEIENFLGTDYEVIDCADLTEQDLPTIFHGATFFDSGKRRILLRDFTANKPIADHFAEHIEDYSNTTHDVVFFETKLDKRSVFYKSLKEKLDFKEFSAPVTNNFKELQDIYTTAKRSGEKAIAKLRKIEHQEDPIMFFGFLVSQALKDFSLNPTSASQKRALKELAKIDLQMKSSAVEPWLLVETALLSLNTSFFSKSS